MNYEQMIRNALARIDDPDEGVRVRVYRSAMNAFEKKFGESDPEALRMHREMLGEAIQLIEAEYQLEKDTIGALEDELGGMVPEQEFQTGQHKPESDPSILPMDAAQTNKQKDNDITMNDQINNNDEGSRSSLMPLGLIALLAASIGLGYYLYNLPKGENQPITVTAEQGQETEQESPGQEAEQESELEESNISPATTTTLLDANLPEDISKFTTAFSGEPNEAQLQSLVSSGNFSGSEKTNLIGREIVSIDPNKIYSGSAIVRLIGDSHDDTKLFIGFASFDADQNHITSPPIPYRYFINAGKLPDDAEKDADGWFEISGTITGTSDNKHTTFRDDARYAKPVLFIRTSGPDTKIEVKSFKIEEVE